MSDVVKCARGHFYDRDVFIKCPHCERKTEEWDTLGTEYRKEVSRYAREYLNENRGSSLERTQKEAEKPYVLETGMKTVKGAKDDGKTIGFAAGHQSNYFVTGWLVCVKGPDTGHVFNLYYGYNTVGYSRENEICLLEDVTIGRKTHCTIVYEDRNNQFYLIPEKDCDTCLNGTEQKEPAELHSGDSIHIGVSDFEFVAFCRDNRKWEREAMRRTIHCR